MPAVSPEQALEKAKKTAKSDSDFARKFEPPLTPQAVRAWKICPAKRVLEVEQISGVPKELLRPDLYVAERKSKKKVAA